MEYKGSICKFCHKPFAAWDVEKHGQYGPHFQQTAEHQRDGHLLGDVSESVFCDREQWCKCGQSEVVASFHYYRRVALLAGR